jgi:hypothetical protein
MKSEMKSTMTTTPEDGVDLDSIPAGTALAPTEVGVCVAEAHPTLAGRVLVRIEREQKSSEQWLPCLLQVRPREGDRLLVIRAAGSAEAIVAGVIDGYRRRADPDVRVANVRTVQDDESVRIQGPDGRGLVEVRASENGCVVTLLSPDATLSGQRSLAIEADEVTIRARQGAVSVSATDDVVVRGETINLN